MAISNPITVDGKTTYLTDIEEAAFEAVQQSALSLTNVTGLVLGTESIGAAGALSTTIPVSLVTAAGADQAMTLADGSTVGQIKILYAVSTANSWKCTPTTTDGAWAKITFTTIGENAILMWSGNGWSVISRGSGATAAADAVEGYGVIA